MHGGVRLKRNTLSFKAIINIMNEICSIDLQNGVTLKIRSVSLIREDDKIMKKQWERYQKNNFYL